MKRKWIQKVLAFASVVVMTAGCLGMQAGAADAYTIKPVTEEYYKELIGAEAKGHAAITINKTIADVEGSTAGQDKVNGVKFGIAKVGVLVQYEQGTTSGMMYQLDKSFAEKVTVGSPDYTDADENVYVKDYSKINKALRDVKPETVTELVKADEKTTGADGNKAGQVQWTGKPYGLYLVVETDVSGAAVNGKDITITHKQYPYVVSAPVYNNGTWSEDVTANAKNETGTSSLEKKIVTAYDGTIGPVTDEGLQDTDVTHVGDMVEFKLTVDMIDLQDADRPLESFVIEDKVSDGLTLPSAWSDTNIKVTASDNTAFVLGTDFNAVTTNSEYKITFTKAGLTKLTELALKGSQELYVYYTAAVNENAVVGDAGNTNTARLIFKVQGSPEIETDWDTVREFIFSMDAVKKFDEKDGTSELNKEVVFELCADEKGEKKLYVTGTDGNYVYAEEGTANAVTEVKLGADGRFAIKGVPVGTDLYLHETKTASGYNLLDKPVKLHLEAAEEAGVYSGYLDETNTTLNGEKVSIGDSAAGVSFTVNNTSGFQLPSTGGMGVWLFAIAAVLVIAAGVIFLARTKKHE